MAEIDDLRRQRAELHERISAIESAERAKDLSALVGRCFRYRNSYSCPDDERDYWWMFTRVTGIRDDTLQGFRFQTDRNGKVEIEHGDVWGVGTLGEEITTETFRAALMVMRESVGAAIEAQLVAA